MEQLSSDEHVAAFEQFLRKYHKKAINVVAEAQDDSISYAIVLDAMSFGTEHCATCLALYFHPEQYLSYLQDALRNVEASFSDKPKPRFQARLRNLDKIRYRQAVSELRNNRDLGTLIEISATVTRTGPNMLRENSRIFQCTQCGFEKKVLGDLSRRGAFTSPVNCPSGENCRVNSMVEVQLEGVNPDCREYQEIKITEKIQSLDIGSIPRSICVVLRDDLADSVKPGDDVQVVGVLTRKWNRNPALDQRCDVEFQIVAVHIQAMNEKKTLFHVSEDAKQSFHSHWTDYRDPASELIGRDIILKSIAPQIFGNYLLKLILAMSLIGGVEYTDPSGSRIRGESHLLIVGDPGTAKSQVLRYAAKISPRSVLTTGCGATSAGLTVTAVRDPSGEWMLDAGALVLADGGVCCIDEFDSIRQHDRGAIHEAMEQQTLSIAKAGLVCTLDTKTTVLATVNPKAGRISTAIGTSNTAEGESADRDESLAITVGIAAPLLSRFDVILTLVDQHEEDWDSRLAEFIMNGYQNVTAEDEKPTEELWSTERLRQYFVYVKTSLQPTLTRNAQRIIKKYYQCERARVERNTARTTVRLLEGLVRLAQAHARLMCHEEASPVDAIFAIAAFESSAVSNPIVGGTGALHAPFPADPGEDFRQYAHQLFENIGLDMDLLEEKKS